jgi:two-component system phosphate regulon sensor histidine kinase PhoR
VRLATRLFIASGLIILATVVGLVAAADGYLRGGLEVETADELEREARLVAALLVPDSSVWPEEARRLGALIGRRVTLVDSGGRVRGDTEFDGASLSRLENHGARPEIVAASRDGVGHDRRVSASTNAAQLYVAVRGGPPGLVSVRVSAPLDAVDAHIGASRGSRARSSPGRSCSSATPPATSPPAGPPRSRSPASPRSRGTSWRCAACTKS